MQHRPVYHFLPEKNWMNDPNGPIYYQGEHHLFYQYNPTDWRWGNLHWGHATSTDLLHWTEQPMALYPAHDRGESHCYSGCSYINGGKIELLYTSVGPGDRNQHSGSQQWVATTDDHIRWNQIAENPAMAADGNGGKTLTEWRDPFVFQWKGETLALVAGIVNDTYNAIHIYRSGDMRRWEYLREFYHNDNPAHVLECPNLIVFGDKVLFIHSIWDVRVLSYFVGTIADDYSLVIQKKGVVDYGDFFASQISFTPEGEPLLWGWLREDPRRGLLTDGEWAGVQAIPRRISLDGENRMVSRRLPALDMLRGREERMDLAGLSDRKRFNLRSNTAEITLTAKTDNVLSVRVLESEDEREYTEIIVNPREGTVLAPIEESSLLKEVDKRPILGCFDRNTDGIVHMDILIDRSVVEIFINDTSCTTLRVYPTLESTGMSISSRGAVAQGEATVYEISL